MAATASGLFTVNWADFLDGTKQGDFAAANGNNKLQLLDTTAGVVPDFDADTNPASGTPATYDAGDPGTSGDYTGGGTDIANEKVSANTGDGGAANTIGFIADDLVMTGTTLDCNACIIFNEDDAVSPVDAMYCLLFFGQTQTTTGTFTVDFPANGFIQIPHV